MAYPSWLTCIPKEIIKVAMKNAVVWLDDVERYFVVAAWMQLCSTVFLARPAVQMSQCSLLCEPRPGAELNAAGQEVSIARAFDEILRRARIITLDRVLTESEVDQAQKLRTDQRIADALNHTARAGFAEYLAAGPAILERWKSARRGEHPAAGAIISGAIDARRAGYLTISRAVLEELYKWYLDAPMRYQQTCLVSMQHWNGLYSRLEARVLALSLLGMKLTSLSTIFLTTFNTSAL